MNNRGFSLVEVLLAAILISGLVLAIIPALITIRESDASNAAYTHAQELAEAGLEAARSIRDGGIANLTAGDHGLTVNGSVWAFSGTNETIGDYTRVINVTNIAAQIAEVTSTVSWTNTPQRTGTVSLVTRLTNWRRSVSGSNWGLPSVLGSLDLTQGFGAEKVAVSGNYAYIVKGSGNPDFFVVDISTPSAPVELASLNVPGNAVDVVASGTTVYIATTDNAAELVVIDVSIPATPTQIGVYNDSGNENGSSLAISGSTVYLGTESGNELLILNVATPATPALLGTLTTLAGTPRSLDILGSTLVIASSDNGQEFQLVSVAVPATPTLVGSLDLAGSDDALAVTVTGTTAILGRTTGDLVTIDISTPATPAILGTLNLGGSIYDLSLGNSDQYAFAATANTTTELQVIDIANPGTPTLVAGADTNGELHGIEYVASPEFVVAVGTDGVAEFIIFQPN